jgi:hypothetical protein
MHGDGVLALDKAHVGLRASGQGSTKTSAATNIARITKDRTISVFVRCCSRDSLVLLRCADAVLVTSLRPSKERVLRTVETLVDGYTKGVARLRAHPRRDDFRCDLDIGAPQHDRVARSSGGGCQAQGVQRIPAHKQDFQRRRRFRRSDVRLSHCRGILPVKAARDKTGPRPNL